MRSIRRLVTIVLCTALASVVMTPGGEATKIAPARTLTAMPSIPPAAQAAACSSTWIYAFQATAQTTQLNHACGVGAIYQGWIGVGGRITTPAVSARLGRPTDHNVGWIGMVGYGASTSWIQIGWYTGSLPDDCPPQANGTYGLYVEYKTRSGYYSCRRLSNLSPGGSVNYRIEYIGNNCWTAYYSNVAAGTGCNLPAAMSAQAVNELYNGSGTSTFMAPSTFGSSAPGTATGLRLKGSTGWQVWDDALTSHGTMQSDWRPYYYMSSSARFYHLRTFTG